MKAMDSPLQKLKKQEEADKAESSPVTGNMVGPIRLGYLDDPRLKLELIG
jgi:hypothetical protein